MAQIEVPVGSVLEVVIEDSRPDVEQSLRVLSMAGNIGIAGTNFEPAESLLILGETYPTFEIEFADPDAESGVLQLWNSWILGDGEHAWIGNSGIIIESLPVPNGASNRLRLWCSDGLGDPDFDDLVLLLTVGPKSAG